jgi:hypothetical protein
MQQKIAIEIIDTVNIELLNCFSTYTCMCGVLAMDVLHLKTDYTVKYSIIGCVLASGGTFPQYTRHLLRRIGILEI